MYIYIIITYTSFSQWERRNYTGGVLVLDGWLAGWLDGWLAARVRPPVRPPARCVAPCPRVRIARPRSPAGNVSMTSALDAGCIKQAESPCRMRPAMRSSADDASPQRTLAEANPTTPARNVERFPKMSPSRPPTAIAAASATMYALAIHAIPVGPRPSSAPMRGPATAVTVRSTKIIDRLPVNAKRTSPRRGVREFAGGAAGVLTEMSSGAGEVTRAAYRNESCLRRAHAERARGTTPRCTLLCTLDHSRPLFFRCRRLASSLQASSLRAPTRAHRKMRLRRRRVLQPEQRPRNGRKRSSTRATPSRSTNRNSKRSTGCNSR